MRTDAVVHARTDWVRRYVDGGRVLLIPRPYTDAQWSVVREGWWWHTAAMALLLPAYPIVALTVWQRPSGQALARRAVWAVLLTVGALALVGLPAFVLFSRRWYWRYRTDTTVVGLDGDVWGAEWGDEPTRGYWRRVAQAGARLADAVDSLAKRTAVAKPPVAVPLLAEPWGSLRDEAVAATLRIAAANSRAEGVVAPAIERAATEARSVLVVADRIATMAAEAERALRRRRASDVDARLSAVAEGHGDPGDLAAARHSLEEELEVLARIAATLERTEGKLHRMVAHLAEAAARADELVLCPPGAPSIELDRLTDALDDLVAIRRALDEVERADLQLGVG